MKSQLPNSEQECLQRFKTLIQELVEKFQPDRIVCFGKQTESSDLNGCFGYKRVEECHYCLLMVTETVTRIDYEVQDFVNAHYKDGQATIICHGKDAINEAITSNSRFFITVLTTGQTVYSRDGIIGLDSIPEFMPDAVLEKAEKYYAHRITLAKGFLSGAYECLANEHFNVCAFMLHQVVEQCCIALIRVQIGYRSEFHNLHRLLNLCRCFSAEPYNLLLSAKSSDRRLFDILTKSYSQARYASSFLVEKDDAGHLYSKVTAFLDLVTCMCKEKIEEFSEIALQYKQRNKESEVEYE